MIIKDLFPVPIGIIDLKDKLKNLREVNTSLIKTFIESLIDEGYKNSTGILEIYQSNRSLELKKGAFNDFLITIKPFVDNFLKDIRFSEEFLTNYKLGSVWGNLTAGTGIHTAHVHGKGAAQPFSLVYFPCEFVNPQNLQNIIFNTSSKPENIGSLLLYSPGWELKEISFNQNDYFAKNKYNQLIYPIQPQEGLLVIFPSFLAHLVTPSLEAKKENARISFSFFAMSL
jgi:hypothetical protein